jgi:hypothetical protein
MANRLRYPLGYDRSPERATSDLPITFGEALRQQYELPEELPSQLLALLAQLAPPQENE